MPDARGLIGQRWYAPGSCLVLACCALSASLARASEFRRTPVVTAVQRVQASVVNIFGEKNVVDERDANAERRVNGMGTGVIVDGRGYVITNHHVVDGVLKIQVGLAGGKTTIAKVVAFDLKTDLAIIKIETDDPLPVIPIGRSDDLMPGEPVVAVGNAYGYGHTVSSGVISALNRKVQVNEVQIYDDLIQTDASINPGNSGGPLVNVDGEMIGINVAVRAGAQGIGFAIPSDKAMAVAAELLANRRGVDFWHGISMRDECAAEGHHARVASVEPGSPAEKAGIQPGDEIRKVEDTKAVRALDFERALLDRKIGDEVRIAVEREGKAVDAVVVLTEAPRRPEAINDRAWDLIGIRVKATAVGANNMRRANARYRGGLNITSIRPGSPAAKQGIRPGDVLVGMHVWETISIDNLNYVLNRPDLTKLNPLKFYIVRDGETLYGHLPVASRERRGQE